MNILVVGDVVGSPGRDAVARLLPGLKKKHAIGFTVVNAENAAAGRGITPALAEELFAAGADVLTLGDHAWDQREILPYLERDPRILRPANFAPGCPGRGITTCATPQGPVTVLSLLGRVFVGQPADCPFRVADALLAALPANHGPILVDIHAEATSEKVAMGWHLDGRVSAVVGSHTHVQTADELIRPGGTAYLTDLGMTGPTHSIIGRTVESVLYRFRTGMPSKFTVASGGVMLQGAVISVRPETGLALSIERIREALP
ncbi:MAG: TIGR00282 family metallophosphoesterase [Kiritimatiellia bacterium]|nr:TIGR00282 family metallophosphoesterase [Kiritimatiellia bacterium]